jgi:hypothetical protein
MDLCPIPPETLQAYHYLIRLLSECGYRLSYDRVNEAKPMAKPYWRWAHWNKYADGSSRWQSGETRLELTLDDYSLDIWCYISGPLVVPPKTNDAHLSLNVKLRTLPEWTPADIAAMEDYFSSWATAVRGVDNPVRFHHDDANSAWQGPS